MNSISRKYTLGGVTLHERFEEEEEDNNKSIDIPTQNNEIDTLIVSTSNSRMRSIVLCVHRERAKVRLGWLFNKSTCALHIFSPILFIYLLLCTKLTKDSLIANPPKSIFSSLYTLI